MPPCLSSSGRRHTRWPSDWSSDVCSSDLREITERTLGKDHPDMATRLNGLATLYGEQGKYAEAEPLLIEAHGITERTLGKDHPDMATRLGNLATLYREQGKHAKAGPNFIDG